MPADPSKGLHANRPFSVPTDGHQLNCFSRTDILDASTRAAFGSGQSMAVVPDGETKQDPTTWPKKWPAQGRVLKVPKTVILSSFPYWTLYWPKCYLYFPRDVIGDTGLGFFGNYYYLEQWNGVDPAANDGPIDYSWLATGGYDLGDPTIDFPGLPGYQNNTAWNDMKFLNPADKLGIYNSRESCRELQGIGCDSIPSFLINKCPTPPLMERYQKGVAEVQNPYYQIHPQLIAAFIQAKEILENDPDDPIYVSIPGWLPPALHQVRNAFLTRTHEELNGAHGGVDNGQPCNVHDVLPCYTEVPMCWAPPYPDTSNPANQMGFDAPTVPWLLGADPGFGTNTLHLYVGHPNMAYTPPNSYFDYQAWPLTPEVQWFGPLAAGSYLGDIRPFFAGRRLIWRNPPFALDYGYINHGAVGLYDSTYGPIVESAAASYKDNFYKYRQFGTRIFTYDAKWNFSWDFNRLYDDRRNNCPATQFYFGFDFPEFAAGYDTVDNNVTDCAPFGGLKFAETHNYFPSLDSINQGITVGNILANRVKLYYNGNDPGSADFFQLSIDRNGLAAYNVSYEGTMPGSFLDADGIVAYVRQYFKENP